MASSSYTISGGTSRVDLSSSITDTYVAIQVTSDSALNGDITVLLQHSSDGINFENLGVATTISSGVDGVLLETYDYTLANLYLYIDVQAATLGILNFFQSTKKKVDSDVTITNDYDLDVSRGLYAGHSNVNIFGSIVNVTADTLEDVWDAGGTYTFPASTADMTHISQTTDQTAARGSSWVIEGLNTSYVEIVQTVLLNASDTTTPVALSTPLFRINKMYMILPDITLTSTVRLHNAAETVDYTDIQTDHNQSLNAIYTVPSEKTAYLVRLGSDYVPTATKNPEAVHFHFQVRRNAGSEPWRVVQSFGVTPGNSIFNIGFTGGIVIEEKSDIRVTTKPEGKDAHVHSSFDLILIDND